MRRLAPVIASAAAFFSVLAATPQAMAEDRAPSSMLVPGTSVEFSENGARDAQTRAIAAEDPAAVSATATLCGSGYTLEIAERLPDASRLGTLFTYTRSTTSMAGACAVFDHNTTTAKHR